MPLDIIGSYAASSSNGASARTAARSSDPPTAATDGFAALTVSTEQTETPESAIATDGALAVYVSPFIRFDVETRLAIVEIRNSQTGEVQQQYPSPRAVREYAQKQPETERQADSEQTSPRPNNPASPAVPGTQSAAPVAPAAAGTAQPSAATAGARQLAIA